MNHTMTKDDLIQIGYGPSHSMNIIRQAKHHMVKQGYSFYSSKKVMRVPVLAVEQVLGFNPLNNNTLLQNEEVSQ